MMSLGQRRDAVWLTTTYRQELAMIRHRSTWVFTALGIACLAYLPVVLDSRTVFGIAIPYIGLTTTQINLALCFPEMPGELYRIELQTL